jgi:hypothetical protein
MADAVIHFLDSIGAKAFWFSATLFVIINGAAIAALVLTRSRRLVDEWTPRLLATDAVLLTTGLGVPLLSGLARIGVHAVAALFGGGVAPVR